MSLTPLELDTRPRPLPPRIAEFLAAGQQAVDEWFERWRRVPYKGFYPSDYDLVHHTLVALREHDPEVSRLLEWGSGLGVVVGLARLLGFDASGIEIDPRLVERSRELLAEHEIEAEIHEGSFLPREFGDAYRTFDPGWRCLEGAPAEDPGRAIADCDVVFAYPWPGDEAVYYEAFDRFAPPGAYWIAYRDLRGVEVLRKAPG